VTVLDVKVLAEIAERVEAIRGEVASRNVPDELCNACERRRWADMVASGDMDGFKPMSGFRGWIRPCAACAVRKPYTWVATIPLPALEAFLIDNWDRPFRIDEMKPLVPKDLARGSSRFEFL